MNITYGNTTYDKEYFDTIYLQKNENATRRALARMESLFNFSRDLNSSMAPEDEAYKNFKYLGYPHDQSALKMVRDHPVVCFFTQAALVLILLLAALGFAGMIVDYIENPGLMQNQAREFQMKLKEINQKSAKKVINRKAATRGSLNEAEMGNEINRTRGEMAKESKLMMAQEVMKEIQAKMDKELLKEPLEELERLKKMA